MKISRKIQNYGLIVITCIALIGFIVGNFVELQLTEKVGDFDNLFGILLTGFGPIPVLEIGVLVSCFLIWMPKLENKNWNFIIRILGIVSGAVMIFAEVKEGLEYVEFPRMEANETTYKVLMLTFLAILNLFTVLFSKIWVKKTDQKALIPLCLLIIGVIALYFIGGEAIKYLASRPRPRVVYIQHRLYYKPWYEWKPLAALFNDEYEGCKSFVSGHAANAACLISLLPLLVVIFKKENCIKLQIILIAIGALFTFVVAYSRIIALAHWLTDVTGGIILSCGAQALVINLAPKIIKKFSK